MNIELTPTMEQLIEGLLMGELYGSTKEEVARRLIEERLRQLLKEGAIYTTVS